MRGADILMAQNAVNSKYNLHSWIVDLIGIPNCVISKFVIVEDKFNTTWVNCLLVVEGIIHTYCVCTPCIIFFYS